MKNFLKLSGLLLMMSVGMLIIQDSAKGQITVSSAYEQGDGPTVPGKLIATPLYYSLIQLTWSDQSNNESGFHVYMRDKYRNQYRLLFDVPANKTTAYIWELEAQTEYFFYVEAFNMYGSSTGSNIANTTTPRSYPTGTPEAPTDLEILSQGKSEVEIGWVDHSDNELGFKIARKIEGEPFFELIDSVETDVLTYREVGLEPDRIYIYKVCAYNMYGFSGYTNTVSFITGDNSIKSDISGDHFQLKGNYPNPFNPSTIIEFTLPQAANVKLSIYNTLGEEVTTISNSFLKAGNYQYEWNASEFSSGIYFYKLETSDFVQVKKMILIK